MGAHCSTITSTTLEYFIFIKKKSFLAFHFISPLPLSSLKQGQRLADVIFPLAFNFKYVLSITFHLRNTSSVDIFTDYILIHAQPFATNISLPPPFFCF